MNLLRIIYLTTINLDVQFGTVVQLEYLYANSKYIMIIRCIAF